MTDTQHTNEQKKIIRLYGAFGASLILSVIPSIITAFLSLSLLMGVLVAAYILRTGTDDHDLLQSHTTHIIRTIWIGSFYALITMTIGGVYLFCNVDNVPLGPCIDQLLMIDPYDANINFYALGAIFETCLDDYMRTNWLVFLIATLLGALPILVYFSVRFIRGLVRANKGYRVTNPQSWWF